MTGRTSPSKRSRPWDSDREDWRYGARYLDDIQSGRRRHGAHPDGEQKIAVGTAIMGRSFNAVIPLINQGRRGWTDDPGVA